MSYISTVAELAPDSSTPPMIMTWSFLGSETAQALNEKINSKYCHKLNPIQSEVGQILSLEAR